MLVLDSAVLSWHSIPQPIFGTRGDYNFTIKVLQLHYQGHGSVCVGVQYNEGVISHFEPVPEKPQDEEVCGGDDDSKKSHQHSPRDGVVQIG